MKSSPGRHLPPLVPGAAISEGEFVRKAPAAEGAEKSEVMAQFLPN